MNQRNHPGIREVVVAVVEVSAQFAAETGVAVAECFLHEGMTHAFPPRGAAVLENLFLYDMAAAEVINDRRAGVVLEEIGHHQCGHDIAGHRLAFFVYHHQPVGIAVEAKTEVGFLLFDRFLQFVQIRVDQRIGVVLERAVMFQVQADEFHTLKVAEDDRHHLAGHPVAGVDHHFDGAVLAVEKLQNVFFVLTGKIAMFNRTVRTAQRVQQRGGDVFNVFEARIGADGFGLLAGNLESVVGGRVVAGGDLNPAAGTQVINCEIHLRRINHADVDDIGSGGIHPLDQGFCQRRAVCPHVAPDTDALGIGQSAVVPVYHRAQELCRCVTNLPGGLLVKLLAVKSANIVGLKN